MAALGNILRVLQVITSLACVNIFTFDQKRRKFQGSRQRYWCALLVQYSLILPLLIIVTALTIHRSANILLRIASESMQGSKAVYAISAIFLMTILYARMATCIYILWLCSSRLTQLRRLLNDFVHCYDQYVKLFGGEIRLRWAKMLFFWSEIFHFNFVFLLRGFASAKGLKVGQQVDEVLMLFGKLMYLRLQLETFVQPLLAVELFLDNCTLIMALHTFAKDGSVLAAGFIYFMLFFCAKILANLSHDICRVQQSLGNDLLRFDDAGDMAAATLQKLEFFCLYKVLLDRNEASYSSALHLGRGFLLVFMDYVFTQSMMLNAIFVTSDEYQHRRIF